MSVTTEETTRETTTGDGTTKVFTYSFTMLRKDDLTVVVTTISSGVEVTLTRIADYLIDLVAKTVTLSVDSIPTTLEKITLSRQTRREQEVVYRVTTKINTATHERVYDRLTLISQDQQDETNRQMIGGIVETSPLTLQDVATRKDLFFQFDGSGDPSNAGSITVIMPTAFWSS